MKRRIWSALLALAMLLTLLPMSAFGAQPVEEIIIQPVGSVETINQVCNAVSLTGQPSTTGLIPGKAYEGQYYDQLNATAKAIYNVIYVSPLKDGPVKPQHTATTTTGMFVIDLAGVPEAERTFSGATMNVTASVSLEGNTRNINITRTSFDETTAAAMLAYASNTVFAAVGALVYDHPELSWLVNTEHAWNYDYNYYKRLDYSSIPDGQSGTVTATNQTITITRFYFAQSPKGYSDATTYLAAGQVTADNWRQADTGDRATLYARIRAAKQAIDKELTAGSTPYDKVVAIHNWICANVAYADTSSSAFQNGWRSYQTAYSALVDGVTVCAGYAKAFKLLCNEYGIPCAVVNGTGGGGDHGWNYVKLNGKWYAVDCTWDDQTSGMITDYFLVGSDTFLGDGTGNTHKEEILYDPIDFTYPVLSTTAYDPSAPVTVDPTPTVSDWKSPFQDVKEGDWFAAPVRWAVENGVTNGTSATTFSPNTTCTQGQILTFLWRAKGSPSPAGAVTGTQYYARAVQWARERGLIGSGFNADSPCTRADVVTYLWNLEGSPSAGTANFSDVPVTASYARAVAWAVEQGVTNGTSATTFSPNGTCTRGQIVTFLYRALAG